MFVDLSKVEADLSKVRQRKTALMEQLEALTAQETELATFINMAQQYTAAPRTRKRVTPLIENRRPAAQAKESGTRFQPHKFPPQPIPEGYVSPNRRMELVRRIAENFDPNTVITAQDIITKIEPIYQIPDNARSKVHHVATVLFHEKGPSAAIEKVGDRRWRIRPNALEVVQSRIAAEIAEASEAAARRAAH